MVNKKRLIEQTRKILRIESENPPGNEYELSMYVKKELEKIGLRTKVYEFAKRRPNVVGYLKGKIGKKTLLLTPHIDTVPAGGGWKFGPYSAKMIDGKIYGRGATDCKGNLAVGIEALRSIKEDKIKLNNNLIFAATVDEESGSIFGLGPLVKKSILRPTEVVVLDSNEFNIIVAQKGLLHFKVKIFGKKAHGAYPDRGVNAIELAVEIIQRLKRYKIKYKRHPLLNPPTVNIGTIKGGDKVNIVADYCDFDVDIRFLPGVKANSVLKQIKKIISSVTSNYKLEIAHAQNPCEIRKDHLLVRHLLKAAKKNKVKSKVKGSEGATVISFFLEKNIPAVATGYGKTKTAHTANEYAMVNSLFKGAKVLIDFIKEADK